jgi:IS5 family transposase
MHHIKMGNQWHFGIKAHIDVDANADSGLVHTVTTTPPNAHYVTQAHALLHRQEEVFFADSGFSGVEKRQEIQDKQAGVDWEIAMMPGKSKVLDKTNASHALTDRI